MHERGRSDRIRTYDPLVPNEVRYQAALHSDMPVAIVAGAEAYRGPCPLPQASFEVLSVARDGRWARPGGEDPASRVDWPDAAFRSLRTVPLDRITILARGCRPSLAPYCGSGRRAAAPPPRVFSATPRVCATKAMGARAGVRFTEASP